MTAYNVVRMRVKPGREQDLIEITKSVDPSVRDRMKKNGMRRTALIKIGERSYCFIGEWDNMDSLARSRPDMIANLDRMRDLLEDLGGGLGVTDPASGEVVVEMT